MCDPKNLLRNNPPNMFFPRKKSDKWIIPERRQAGNKKRPKDVKSSENLFSVVVQRHVRKRKRPNEATQKTKVPASQDPVAVQ